MKHMHTITDSNTPFVIDDTTRKISGEKRKLIQGDHNSEKITFKAPRYIEGHDILKCNKVELHFTNTDARTRGRKKSKGIYEITDCKVNSENDSSVIFSCNIKSDATVYAGTLSFSVWLFCIENGETVYQWGTLPCTDISIAEGEYCAETVEQGYPYILERLVEKAKDDIEEQIDVHMRISDGKIQFSTDKKDWEDVIALSKLKGDTGLKGDKGEKGDKGDKGDAGEKGIAGKDYVLTETDKNEIAAQAAGMIDVPESSNVQGDFSQNDENAPDFIKNRTHYKEEIKEVVFPKQKVSVYGGGAFSHFYPLKDLSLIAGNKYFVTLNGKEYSCIAEAGIDSNIPYKNLSIEGVFDIIENAIYEVVMESTAALATADSTDEDIELLITTPVIKAHYLSPEYIKDMYYETDTTDIITETEGVLEDEEDGVYCWGFFCYCEFVAGETYTICLNDSEYVTVATDIGDDGIYLGDVYTFSGEQYGIEATGEPFVVTSIKEEETEYTMLLTTLEFETLKLSVKKSTKEVKKIDDKFIPDTVLRKVSIEKTINTSDWVLNNEKYSCKIQAPVKKEDLMVIASPVNENRAEWNECNCKIIDWATDSVTLKADSLPSNNFTVNIIRVV